MGYLRVFLAICVVLAHLDVNLLLSADHAVETFFVISGFYMSFVLNERYVSSAQNLNFFKKRFIRLLPIYWICCVVGLCLSYFLYKKGLSTIFLFDIELFKKSTFDDYVFLIFSNLFALGEDVSMFLFWNNDISQIQFSLSSFSEQFPMARFYCSPVAWSLGLELSFYLIAPFLLRRKMKTVLVVFCLSLLVKFIVRYYFGLNDGNWTYRFFPSELCCFCLGYFCYKIYKKIKACKARINKKIKYVLFLFLICLSVYKSIYLLTFTLLQIYLVFSIPILFYLCKDDNIDRNIGNLSYIIYLVHPIVICCFSFNNSSVKPLIVILLTILVSLLLYIVIQRPIDRYRTCM